MNIWKVLPFLFWEKASFRAEVSLDNGSPIITLDVNELHIRWQSDTVIWGMYGLFWTKVYMNKHHIHLVMGSIGREILHLVIDSEGTIEVLGARKTKQRKEGRKIER